MNAVPKFVDKFAFDEDPFSSGNFSTKTNGNDGNNNFDPFGAPVAATDKEASTAFFEADFSNAFNDSGLSTTTNGNSVWGNSLDKKNNNSSSAKVQKFNKSEVAKINKFSGDYSDNYEEDLQKALKRSVMDQ